MSRSKSILELAGKIESIASSIDGIDYEDLGIVVEVVREVFVPELERRLAYRNGVEIKADEIEFVDKRGK